ncbi:hypothetical protein [Campylobacter lanienae]|nr:hypothetical protein [Campylobacter lanienae]
MKFGFLWVELAFCVAFYGWVVNFCGWCFWVRLWNLDTTAEFGSGI